MATKKPILNFVIDEKLIEKIDVYRYANKIPTRAEAVRELIEKGLSQPSV